MVEIPRSAGVSDLLPGAYTVGSYYWNDAHRSAAAAQCGRLALRTNRDREEGRNASGARCGRCRRAAVRCFSPLAATCWHSLVAPRPWGPIEDWRSRHMFGCAGVRGWSCAVPGSGVWRVRRRARSAHARVIQPVVAARIHGCCYRKLASAFVLAPGL